MQKVLIFVAYGYFRLHKHYIKALWEIYIKHKTQTFFFCEFLEKEDVQKIEPLKKLWIHIFSYKNHSDLENMVQACSEKYEIVYIDTMQEDLVPLTHKLKDKYVFPITYDFELFSSKERQRYYIDKNAPEISIKHKHINIQECNYDSLSKHLGTPFLVKPTKDSWSSRVSLIHTKKDLDRYKNLPKDKCHFMAEEFLDGTLCSIDYFVDKSGKVSYTFPYVIYIATSIWIDDFFVYSWWPTENMQDIFKYSDLQRFIERTVEASNITNTFVAHEFMVLKNWEMRTIEINGRIWMWNILFFEHGYNINPYNFLFQPKPQIEAPQKKYFHHYKVFPLAWGILKSFNYELIEKIHALPSCIFTEFYADKFEWQRIGLAKDGFWRVWLIYLSHSDKEQFEKDCNFVKENYANILIMQYDS